MEHPAANTAICDRNGINWQVANEYTDLIKEFSLEKLLHGNCIKKSPAREVWFIKLAKEDCVLKIFHTPVFWDRVRTYLFSSKAIWEWQNLHKLQSLAINVPKALAVGHRKRDSYLLLKKIPQVLTLKEFAISSPPFSDKRRMGQIVAHLLAQLHNNKIIHRDLHFGNIVYDGSGKIYLLDLHSIKQRRWRMRHKHCLQNLAMFGSAFMLFATYTEHLHFWQQYSSACKAFPCKGWQCGALLAQKYLHNYQLRFWRKRGKRCLKDNKYFQKLKLGKAIILKHRSDNNSIKAFRNLSQMIAQGIILKESRSSLVVKTPYGILKQYRRKKWRNLFFDCFRKSRARRAWIAGYQCYNRGIATAAPLGILEHRVGPVLRDNYLISEEIQNSQTLYDYMQSFGSAPQQANFAHKKKLLQALARIVRRLHLRGMSHRDLKSNNWLVDSNARLYLIDLDGLRMVKFINRRRRCKDLKRLIRALRAIPEITRTDLVRVILSYLPFAAKKEQRWWISELIF